MKIIKKISAILILGVLVISSTYAQGIPDEPMVIYGSVNGADGQKMKIYDGNHKLLKEVLVSNTNFGTKKTFDIKNKILLEKFNGILSFEINGVKIKEITKGEINICNKDPIFQKGSICEYNLFYYIKSHGGHHHSHHSSSSSSSSSSNSNSSNSSNNSGNNQDTNQSKNNDGEDDGKSSNKDSEKKDKDFKKEVFKKLKNISPILKGSKNDEKYNKFVFNFAKKIKDKFIDDKNKQKAFEYINKITELKEQKLERSKLKLELYKIKRGFKLLVLREKILRKLHKKGSITERKSVNNFNNDARAQKLRQIKERILAKLRRR